MKKVIISVKDTVAEVFNDPRVEVNAGSAIRAFTNSIQGNKNKDDFTLYIVGEFDTQNGEVEPCDPVKIYSGHDVKTEEIYSMSDHERDIATA